MRRFLSSVVVFVTLISPTPSLSWLQAADPPPVIIGMPSSATVEAVDASGAPFSYATPTAEDDPDGSLPVNCSPGSGTFQLGVTTVVCTTGPDSSGQSTTESFTVDVVDTTAPVIGPVSSPGPVEATSPSGTAATYGSPTATDAVDGSVAVNCAPASGSAFSVGANSVTCAATDAHGNTASAGLTITITDTTKPTLGALPAPSPVEAASPSGTGVSYSLPTASDNGDPNPTVQCTPSSGSSFPLGDTAVTCTAQDASGNVSDASAPFMITVRDTSDPVLVGVPSSFTVEASSASGAVVTYATPGAMDNADASPTVGCLPASGSTFGIGTTTVTCTAADNSGNVAPGQTFSVTVADRVAPSFTGVSPNRQVEANGPGGSIVNFPLPTATDGIEGPIAGVSCVPQSGSLFGLGTTPVSCTASDSRGNLATTSFQVAVVDTVAPALVVPDPRSVYATSAEGISDSDPAIVAFITAASAADLVDPHPSLRTDVQHVLPVGVTPVAFFARDASGNVSSRQVLLTVLPQPPAGTPPLPIPPAPRPPADVRNLVAEPLDRAVRLRWTRPAGVGRVVVTRSRSGEGAEPIVYSGPATSHVDRGLENGVEYRYVVVSVDDADNRSAGVAVVVVPRPNLLRSPRDGARLRKPPRLLWAANAEAEYYNVQVLLNGRKILSVWPTAASFQVRKTWKYLGRRYRLNRGVYRWYVWPGFGPRSAVDYGPMLGSRSFQIVR